MKITNVLLIGYSMVAACLLSCSLANGQQARYGVPTVPTLQTEPTIPTGVVAVQALSAPMLRPRTKTDPIATESATTAPLFQVVATQEVIQNLDTRYTTAQMTGPLTNPVALFADLHIENDFRDEPAMPSPLVRSAPLNSPWDTVTSPEWLPVFYAWVTPTFYHRPLYFEQVNMERYGNHPKVAPLYSAAHFFGSIGLMPYKLLSQHPGERVYSLGNLRPGDCVPFQRGALFGQSYPLEAARYFHGRSGHTLSK